MSSEAESGCLGELWGYFIALGQLLQVITLILQDKKYGHRQSNKRPQPYSNYTNLQNPPTSYLSEVSEHFGFN